MLGLQIKDLVYVPKSDFVRQGLGQDLAEQRFKHREDRRAKYIAEVKSARLRIITESAESPTLKETDIRGKSVSPVRDMEQRERKLLAKLQKHKEKQLDLALNSEARQLQLLQDLEEAKEREAIREKQRLERLQQKQRVLNAQKITFETAISKRISSKEPLIDPKEDSFDVKLKELQGKLAKRALERQKVKEEVMNSSGNWVDESLAKRMKVLETEESWIAMQSEHSLEIDEKMRRHEEHMRNLQAQRAKQHNERISRQMLKADRLQSLEREKTREIETIRQQIALRDLSAEQRYISQSRLKEEHINSFALQEACKQQLNLQRRMVKRLEEQKKVEICIAERREYEEKLGKKREVMEKEWKLRREIQEEKRSDRYKEAKRLQMVEEYQRGLKLAQIQAEERHIAAIQAAKAQEQQLKQQLRKEIELEKKEFGDQLDKVMVSHSRIRLNRSFQRPISLSPSRNQAISRTPVGAPEPMSLNRSVSDVSEGNLEEVREKHDRELMEQLRLENERERARAQELSQARNEQEAQDMEARFRLERAAANQRIVALSE